MLTQRNSRNNIHSKTRLVVSFYHQSRLSHAVREA